jgi:HEAT repeat protein
MKRFISSFVFAFLGMFLAWQAEVLAHGGSHPTPWPTPPPDTPTPTPTPPPTPTPTPTPSPTPTPTPRPGVTPAPTPTPTPTGTMGMAEVKWKTWWEINKWRFTWTPQRKGTTTGEEGAGGPTDQLVEFLVKNLDHKYFDVRGAAALALGRAGGKAAGKAVGPLQKLTADQNAVAAESATLALGMLGSKESIPVLLEILQGAEKTARLRAHAAVALGLVADASAARPMAELIQNPKTPEQVKAGCMMGLALMKHEPSAQVMLDVLSKPGQYEEELRAMAATALGKMGFHEIRKGSGRVNVVETLVGVLAVAGAGKDRKLQLSAVMAVCALGPSGKITEEKLVERLGMLFANERNADIRSFILIGIAELARTGRAQDRARALFRNVLKNESNQTLLAFACLAAGLSEDRESISSLRNLFTSKSNPDLRSAAAVGLGLLKDVESTQMLLGEINGKAEPELKGYCCISLGLMGARDNKEALPTLRDVLVNGNIPELRAAAAMALTLLGESNAVGELLKAVEEGNSYIRMSIIMAIGYFRDMSTVAPLIKLFESENGMNDEIRAIILTALGYITEEAEQPVLKKLAMHYNYLNEKYDALLQIVKLL